MTAAYSVGQWRSEVSLRTHGVYAALGVMIAVQPVVHPQLRNV